MATQELLSSDELSFIHQLLDSAEQESDQSIALQLPLSGLMLPLLEKAEQLVLVANYRHHLLRLPVRFRRDEFGRGGLQLEAPEILETGPQLRNWRLQPLRPLRLLDEQGRDIGLRIYDLSMSGLVLTFEPQDSVPELLNLQLELPDDSNLLPLEMAQVRRLGDGRVAYRLVSDGDDSIERLRWFLFRQHRHLHGQGG